jgi:hypothetical protein
MACNGEPFNIITSKIGDEYEPSMDEALVNVQEKFGTCKMTMTTEDCAGLISSKSSIRE